MRQRLKLAGLLWGPFAKAAFFFPSSRCDSSQELLLRQQAYGFQASRFSHGLKRAKIDMRRKILLAGMGERIAAGNMPVLSSQGPLGSFRHQELVRYQSVINR